MYKQAAFGKYRFQTSKGPLNVEQLCDLSLEELNSLAISLETEYKASGGKSFLVKKSPKNKELKAKFNIVLDILTTKVEASEILSNAAENKKFNNRINELIAKKQDEELAGKSIEELEEMMKK